MLHGTKLSVPRHLHALAVQNADAISQITKDAYNFIYSRCNRSIELATVVAISVSTLTQEYESGEHRPAAEVLAEVERENHEILHGPDERRAAFVVAGAKEFDLERIDRVATALYSANYEILQPGAGVGLTLDDPRVNAETRTQYRWAAIVALGADRAA
jgi:hypothetical protein